MPESKKVVIKVDVHDDKGKRNALKAVSSLSGIESLAMDMKDRKMTLTGNIDPVDVVGKLKKWHTEIVTVGPAKEEKKGDKKDDKKDDKKGGDKKEKTEEEKKKEAEAEAIRKWMEAYRPYYNPYMSQRYCVHSFEDDPNGCVIC